MRFHVTRNRILSIVLAVCLILPISPLTASAEELPMPESDPAPLAAATGYARGIVGTNIITVTLNSGTFVSNATLSHTQFSLSSSGGQTISGIYRDSDSVIRLSLSQNIGSTHNLSITANQAAFADGTETFGTIDVDKATRAVGTATATAGAMDIVVKLTSGTFNMHQYKQYWTLSGTASGGTSIAAVTYVGQQEVKITLTNNIATDNELFLNADQSAFANTASAPFAALLRVTISGGTGETNVCEIGSVGYPTLDGALLAVPTGGAVATTITLLDSLSHDGLVIDNKKVTINPNGHTLTLGKDSETTAGLEVKNGGVFLLIDYASGQVNAISKGTAVTAEGTNSHARVYNATSVNGLAAYAQTGGKITVKNDAVGKSGIRSGKIGDTATSRIDVLGGVTATDDNYNGVAVEAMAGGAVTVYKDVIAAGKGGIGVRASGVRNNNPSFPTEVILAGNVQAGRIGVDASDAALVEVNKDVTAGAGSSTHAYGVWAQTQAHVKVNGNVTAANDHADSIGAWARSSAPSTTTKITIGGTLSGKTYIKLGNVSKTPAQKDDPSADASSVYDTYTYTDSSFGTHSVWVKKGASSPTPLPTPIGLAWDTGTAGTIKAKWNPVAGAQNYAVQLYKAGDSSGHKGAVDTTATSVDLTAFIQASGTGNYTFRIKALAPSGSPDYTDSVIAISPAYSYTIPAVIPAEGLAEGQGFTSSFSVRLMQGAFSAVQDNSYWILGGNDAAANPIVGITYISNTEVRITLTNDMSINDQLTITATQEAFANSATAPFVSPLTLRITNQPTYVCTIDEVAYPTLKSALQFALESPEDSKTIVLATDIRHTEPIVIQGKNITFDLNSQNLVIDTSGTPESTALAVDNGSVKYKGTGSFTVCGDRFGVKAQFGSKVWVSQILIKNPGKLWNPTRDVYGAHARYGNSEEEGSQITVTGSIRTLMGNPCENALGAFAGQDSTVTVSGNIFIQGDYACGMAAGGMNDGNGTVSTGNVTVTGESATGVKAAGESTATVNGAVTAAGSYAVGVDSNIGEDGSGGTVNVKGDVTATGANSTGVICFSSEPDPESPRARSTVKVEGLISGHNYLNIDNALRGQSSKDSEAEGYWIYDGQHGSLVKAKDPDSVVIPGGNVPTAPQNFTAQPGNGQMLLSWTAPVNNGSSAITNYQVSKDNGVSWTNVGLMTSYTFINLTNGTEYTFKVRAVNDAGNGAEASTAATPTAAPTVPAAPRNLTAYPGYGRVQLNWDTPVSNGGSAITQYEVSKNNGADWTAIGLNTYHSFTGLTNGTEYTFKVRAVNSVGPGAEVSVTATPTSSQSPPVPGSGNSSPAPKYEAQVTDGSSSVKVVAEVKAGNLSAELIPAQVAGNRDITVTMPLVSGVTSYSLGIPVPDLSTNSGQGSITLNTASGNLTLPSDMLTGTDAASGSKAQVQMSTVKPSDLPADAREKVGNHPILSLSLSIDGKQTDWNNPSSPVTVSIPYTPTAEELANPDRITVWYIDSKGNLVEMSDARYDPVTKSVVFTTTHFSFYAVGYNAPPSSFRDVLPGAWYYEAVTFIAEKGITTGTGNDKFSPQAPLTRGQFLVMLMRAYGIEADAVYTDNFSDAGNTYYTDYLATAKAKGISKGIGQNKFGPEQAITRQEMFTLLYNTLTLINALPTGDTGKTLADFSDSSKAASWAREPLTALVKSGTLSGAGGKLNPAEITTRAQMAQVLYNLLSK